MRIPHQYVRGKCICCGSRQPLVALPAPTDPDRQGSGPTTFSGEPGTGETPSQEALYDDCPGARSAIIRSLVVLVPVLFLLFGWPLAILAGIGGLLFLRFSLTLEDQKWHGLRNVQEEYLALLQSVRQQKRVYYIKLLDAALQPLFGQRDKAFNAQAILCGESLEEIEFKIDRIRQKSQNLTDSALIELYRNQLKDLSENKKKFERLQEFLEKFEASRNCAAESIRLLRNRILINESGDGDAEELKIIEDLKSLHTIYEKVSGPPRAEQPGMAARSDPPSGHVPDGWGTDLPSASDEDDPELPPRRPNGRKLPE
jgi:hypothetical protein